MTKFTEIIQSAERFNPNAQPSKEWVERVNQSVRRARLQRKIFHAASLGTVVVVLLLTSSNIYAQGVAPDHLLYPMKVISENVVVWVVPRSQKVFIYKHLIDRRVEEVKLNSAFASQLTPRFQSLLAAQERLISQEEGAQALSHTIEQTTMFERDIERLRRIQEARELALALTLHHQRLLVEVEQKLLETGNNKTFQTPSDIPLVRIVSFQGEISSPTPSSVQSQVTSLLKMKDSLQETPSLNAEQIIEILKTKNTLQLELLGAQ